MSLPWDRWKPEEPEEPDPFPIDKEPELPYVPPDFGFPEVPVRPIDPVDRPKPRPPVSDDAIKDALDKLWPDLREDAVGYLKDSWSEIRAGKTVDVLHPTVTAETAAGKELVVADAKSRSWRTLVQGLIVDVIAAIVIVLGMLTELDPFVKESWILIGALLVKSVLAAVISYFMRLKVQPTIKLPEVRMNVMPLPTRIEEENVP